MPPHRQTRRPAPTAAARGGAALVLIALATSAAAQIVPTGVPAADILLFRALGEQRVFLTCSVLDGQAHLAIRQVWDHEVTAATAILTAANVPVEAIAAFTEAAKAENLLPAPDTPWSDVKQFCDAYPDWRSDHARLAFTILEQNLPLVFE